jgi:hypothetical protein
MKNWESLVIDVEKGNHDSLYEYLNDLSAGLSNEC